MISHRKGNILIIPFFIVLGLMSMGNYVFSQTSRTMNYNFQVKQFPTENQDSSLVRFYIAVSFGSLVFVHGDSGFVAAFNFNLFIQDNEKNLIYENPWREKVLARSYRQTSNDSITIQLKDQVTLKSGKYKIIVEAIDENVGLSRYRELELIVRDGTGEVLALGEILNVYELVDKDFAFDELHPIPNNTIRNKFSLVSEAFVVEQNIHWTGEVIWIENNEEIRRDDLNLFHVGRKLKLFRSYSIEDTPLGHFSVFFRLKGNDFTLKTLPIELEIFKLVAFMDEENLDKAVEQLQYIGSGAIYDSLTSATTIEQKQHWFGQFWNTNYPSNDSLQNPIKEEFYRRIRYSNRAFGSGFEGWKTDRGRTYIVYGPPDEIDRRTNERMWHYEIWAYTSLRKQFIFVDEYGTGNYRLYQEY